MSVKDKRKRRYVIERDFQYRFTLRLFIVGGSLFFTYGGLVLFYIRLNYEALVRSALIQLPPSSVQTMQQEFLKLSLSLVFVLALVMAFLFGLGLVLTHKIAGPLVAFNGRFKDIAAGKTGVRVRLREGDEFQEMAQNFNLAVERVEDSQKKLLAVIGESLSDLRESNPKSAQTRLAQCLEDNKLT